MWKISQKIADSEIFFADALHCGRRLFAHLYRYPRPLPEELFDQLGSARVFSQIDLRLGYWQMLAKPGDIHKTAFKMSWRLYEFLVMPFGVTNAPAQFMNMMNDLLGEYLDKFVLVSLTMS